MFLFAVSFFTGFIIAMICLKLGNRKLKSLLFPTWKTHASLYEWFKHNRNLETEHKQNNHLPDENLLQSDLILAPGTFDSLQLRDGFEEDTISTSRFYSILVRVLRRYRLKDRTALYKILSSATVLRFLPEIIDRKDQIKSQPYLRKTADWLCYKSSHRGALKIGLVLQGLVDDQDYEDFILLGSHDETAYWACVGLKLRFNDPQAYLFEIMKLNQGWGRIQAIRFLSNPVNQSIKSWLIMEGYKNNILIAETILDIWRIARPLETFNSQEEINPEIFPRILDIYQVMLTQVHPLQIQQCEGFEELLIVMFKELRRLRPMDQFQNIIKRNLSTYNACRTIQLFFKNGMVELPPFNGLDFQLSDAQAILECLQELIDLDRAGWTEVIDKELFKDSLDSYAEACGAAAEFGMDIWPIHRQRLLKHPCNPLLWSALCSTNDQRRAEKCIEIAIQILPLSDIASGPSKQIGIPPNSQSHYCLQIVLNHLIDFPGRGHQLISAALMSPLVLNRLFALQVLDHWRKSQLDDLQSYDEILKRALLSEVETSLKQRLRNLISHKDLDDGVEEAPNTDHSPRQYLIDERGIKYWEPDQSI